MADAERWAAGMPVPAYAIDDQTAIKVVDGAVEVVSEGHWKLFTPCTRRWHRILRAQPSRPEDGIRPFASLTANRCRVGLVAKVETAPSAI